MNSVVRKSIVYAVVWGLPAAVSMAATSILSRIVGAEAFGTYALTLSTALFISALAFQWIRFSALRFISEEPTAAADGVLATRAATTKVAALLLVLGVIVAAFSKSPITLAAAIIAILQGCFELGLAIARSRDRTAAFGIASVIRTAGLLGFGTITGFLLGGGWALLLALAASLLIANISLAPQWSGRPGRASPAILRKYWSFGWPASLAASLVASVPAMERFAINWLLDTSAVGKFTTASDMLTQLVLAGFIAIGLASFPSLVFIHTNKSRSDLHEAWRNVTTLLTLVGTVVSAFLASFREELAFLLVGSEYRLAFIDLLPYLVSSAMLNGFRSYALDPAFHLSTRTRTLIYISTLILFVNFFCIVLLAPNTGLLGVAQASTIALTAGAALSWYLARKTGLISIATREQFILVSCCLSAIFLNSYFFQANTTAMWAIRGFIIAIVYLLGIGSIWRLRARSELRHLS